MNYYSETEEPRQDYTGYGFASGGFNPTVSEQDIVRTNKLMADKMSDFMQKLDPFLNRSLELLAKAQVRQGATPEEARRAAFSSSQGQLLSDGLWAARRAGILGYGDPVATGQNFLQGTASGGFKIDMIDYQGRAVGRNQSVTGNGELAGNVSMLMAKSVMERLYGRDNADPSSLYGFDMESTSKVYKLIAQRGGLGNVGKRIRFSEDPASRDYKRSAENIDRKLAIMREQEVDKDIRAGLEQVNSENISSKIAQYRSLGDTKNAAALESALNGGVIDVLDEKNKNRVADLVKETVRGMGVLKEIYGALDDESLMRMLESLSGKRITDTGDPAVARKAVEMVRRTAGIAAANGLTVETINESILQRAKGIQSGVADIYGNNLGEGGVNAYSGNAISIGLSTAINNTSISTAAELRRFASSNQLQEKSIDEIQRDNAAQVSAWMKQNAAMPLLSGLAERHPEMRKNYRTIYDKYLRATDPAERNALNALAEKEIYNATKMGSQQYALTAEGRISLEQMDADGLVRLATVNSAADVKSTLPALLNSAKAPPNPDKIVSMIMSRIGAPGFADLVGGKAKVADLVKQNIFNQSEGDDLQKLLSAIPAKNKKGAIEALYNTSGVGRSIAEQKNTAYAFSDEERGTIDSGDLSIKSILNAIMKDPTKNRLNTDTKKIYAVRAAQKENLFGDKRPVAEVNFRDGISKKELDRINAAIDDKDFNLAKELGFDSNEDMLRSASGPDSWTAGEMLRKLRESGKVVLGGPPEKMFIMNKGAEANADAMASRLERVARYKRTFGMEPGASNESLQHYLKTGEWKASAYSPTLNADGPQSVFNSKGKTDFRSQAGPWWSRFADFVAEGPLHLKDDGDPKDKAYFPQAGRLRTMARDLLDKSTQQSMIGVDVMSNGAVLNALEEQLKNYADAQGRNAKTIVTDGAEKGSYDTIDISKAMKELTEAIAVLKNNSATSPSHMTVEAMEVKVTGP